MSEKFSECYILCGRQQKVDMHVAIVAPGLHRVSRGAEVAFEAIGRELSKLNDVEVTLFGSGNPRRHEPYRFVQVGNVPREKFETWPTFPVLRNEYCYEELTFCWNLLRCYQPTDFDATITCSYPFVNWVLQRGSPRPAHIFVTQNGDHPAQSNRSEYAWFHCDGLVCTNLEYFERNKKTWNARLITNGVDSDRFYPKQVSRQALGLPEESPIVLMVSALIPSKRVDQGVRAAAAIPDLHLVVCGDGPERTKITELGHELMPGRIHLRQMPYDLMPDMYRAADTFMHLSLDEPFGNVYLEALSTGLPAVVHDNTVSRWILEDQAVFVDSTRTEAVTQGLSDSLKTRSPQATAQRRELITRRFTWQQIGFQYYEFITSVLGHKSGQRG